MTGGLVFDMCEEVPAGIAGIINLVCSKCKAVMISIPTTNNMPNEKRKGGRALKEVNLRAVLAAIHTGIDAEQMSIILGILDSPAPSKTPSAVKEACDRAGLPVPATRHDPNHYAKVARGHLWRSRRR